MLPALISSSWPRTVFTASAVPRYTAPPIPRTPSTISAMHPQQPVRIQKSGPLPFLGGGPPMGGGAPPPPGGRAAARAGGGGGAPAARGGGGGGGGAARGGAGVAVVAGGGKVGGEKLG